MISSQAKEEPWSTITASPGSVSGFSDIVGDHLSFSVGGPGELPPDCTRWEPTDGLVSGKVVSDFTIEIDTLGPETILAPDDAITRLGDLVRRQHRYGVLSPRERAARNKRRKQTRASRRRNRR